VVNFFGTFILGKQAQKSRKTFKRYVSKGTEKATRYKMWPSGRDRTGIEMAVLHCDVVPEYSNDPMTNTSLPPAD